MQTALTLKKPFIAFFLLLMIQVLFLHEMKGQDPDSTDYPGFYWSAGADLYFAYDLARPPSKNRGYTTQAARHNEFNLNWGFIQANYQEEKIRGTFALHAGTYVTFNYVEEPSDLVRSVALANVGLKLGDKTWVDMGILPGHMGYESVFSLENEMYTRAWMTEYSPYFSTGIQLTSELSDQLTFTGVVLNGWQNIWSINDGKAIGINLNYRANEQWEFNYGNYLGDEGFGGNDRRLRFYNHAYVKYQLHPDFHIVASADVGLQERVDDTAWWLTYMLIVEKKLTDQMSLAGRIEAFIDPDNVIDFGTFQQGFQAHRLAFCYTWRPHPRMAVRAESQYQLANDAIFEGRGGPQDNNVVLIGSMALFFGQ